MDFLFNNILGIIIACVIILLYMHIKRKLNYFADRGMAYHKTTFINQIKAISFRDIFEPSKELYDKYSSTDKQYIGFFSAFLTPNIMILDTNLSESIMIKDFSHFQDHGFNVDMDSNPLFGHLFNMKGDQWRTLRHKLTPTFTSGKLKGMIPTMNSCADTLINNIKQDDKYKEDVNLKELMSSYTLAVIAICVFGVEPDSFQDADCEFKRFFKMLMNPNYFLLIKGTISMFFPKVQKLLNLKFLPKEVEDFFFNLTKETLELRKKSGEKRNDFIQLLLELKEKGSVDIDTKDLEEDEKEKMKEIQSHNVTTKLEFTDELLTAQAFIFLLAGYDNSAFLATITAYHLSKHPEMQKRVREEVKEMKGKFGSIDYAALREMKYLGACIDEAIRLHAPLELLMRECTKKFTTKNGEIFEEGLKIIIPIKFIHRDPKFWVNPDEYNPDRFLNGENRRSGTYMPFGDGPRICIAQRMALIIAKIVLSKTIEEFEILPSSKTKEPIKLLGLNRADIVGGFWGSFKQV